MSRRPPLHLEQPPGEYADDPAGEYLPDEDDDGLFLDDETAPDGGEYDPDNRYRRGDPDGPDRNGAFDGFQVVSDAEGGL